MQLERLNQYKIMWIFVFFDLPTESALDRKAYALFRKNLLKNGYIMFQYSIYIRHCSSRENMDVHIKRIEKFLPEYGHICAVHLTDKQFGDIKIFHGKKSQKPPGAAVQLELF